MCSLFLIYQTITLKSMFPTFSARITGNISEWKVVEGQKKVHFLHVLEISGDDYEPFLLSFETPPFWIFFNSFYHSIISFAFWLLPLRVYISIWICFPVFPVWIINFIPFQLVLMEFIEEIMYTPCPYKLKFVSSNGIECL